MSVCVYFLSPYRLLLTEQNDKISWQTSGQHCYAAEILLYQRPSSLRQKCSKTEPSSRQLCKKVSIKAGKVTKSKENSCKLSKN